MSEPSSSSLADYLAKNYLNPDKPSSKKGKKKSKKSKRDDTAEDGGFVIADDDDNFGWGATGQAGGGDDDGQYIVAGKTSDFKKSQQSSWKIVGELAPSAASLAQDREQAMADSIINGVAAERVAQARQEEDDEAPVMMESGGRAGLQTAADLAAQVEAKKRADQEAMEAVTKAAGNLTHQTVYRDASGRIVDIALKKSEARRKAEESARQKRRDETAALKGDAQAEEERGRRDELEKAKTMGVSRTEDDVEMNEMLKKQIRWDDPAAALIARAAAGKRSETRAKNENDGDGDGDIATITAVPGGDRVYRGGFEPNRYGIRPGHRWDGIDRSNGFEKKYIGATNRRRDREKLEYAWQMDE